ncbi:MAG: dynamin family protein [Lachnospiraceae bacterium]|nr:dynamin family protein [Lachnospiraceae bacterium]
MELEEAKRQLDRIKANGNRKNTEFTVAFCGVFSSGKSSLLNALLNYEEFQLPIGSFPITKLVTRIRYGKNPGFYLYIHNEGQRVQISREEFELLVVGKKQPPEGCKEIVLTIPAEILKSGAVFLDTPGFLDEMGGELEAVSRQAVMQSDLAVFCASAAQLGNQFEKEYIEELEQSIGNYCMIVSHMDCCNTEEDRQDILAKAEKLMTGKGGGILGSLPDGNCFFTITAGTNKMLGGFGTYICYILENNSLKEGLKASTSKKIREFQKRELAEKIGTELRACEAELTDLTDRHDKIVSEQRMTQGLKRVEAQQKQESKFALYESDMVHLANLIEKDLQYLKEKEIIDEFAVKARNYICERMFPMAKKVDKELFQEESPEELYLFFRKTIESFEIPAPKRTAVKNRGMLGRALLTAVNFAFLDFEVDDGYDYEYRDYHVPAVNAFRKELMPKLTEGLKRKTGSFYRIPEIEPESGLEHVIREQKKLISEWKTLLKECMREPEVQQDKETGKKKGILFLTAQGISGRLKGRPQSVRPDDVLLVGRAAECGICFPNDAKGVSREHLSIQLTKFGWTVKDLDSSYGTYSANGVRLLPGTEWKLHNGDRIYLGTRENYLTITIS